MVMFRILIQLVHQVSTRILVQQGTGVEATSRPRGVHVFVHHLRGLVLLLLHHLQVGPLGVPITVLHHLIVKVGALLGHSHGFVVVGPEHF